MQGGKGNGIMDQAGWDREQDHGSGWGETGNGIMDQDRMRQGMGSWIRQGWMMPKEQQGKAPASQKPNLSWEQLENEK